MGFTLGNFKFELIFFFFFENEATHNVIKIVKFKAGLFSCGLNYFHQQGLQVCLFRFTQWSLALRCTFMHDNPKSQP